MDEDEALLLLNMGVMRVVLDFNPEEFEDDTEEESVDAEDGDATLVVFEEDVGAETTASGGEELKRLD